MEGFQRLRMDIIYKGLCTGCGTCIGVCPRNSLHFDYDLEEPVLSGSCHHKCDLCLRVCPGKDIPKPEFDKMLFNRHRDPSNEQAGIVSQHLRGQSTDSSIRLAGASGGCGSALLIYALEEGLVDAVVVAMMDAEKPWRVKPALVRTKEEVKAAGQSKLTIVPTNSVFQEIINHGVDRIGIVGLPCHTHGIRKMQLLQLPARIIKSIQFVLGLYCGANWTYRATEHLIEEYCGVPLAEVEKVEYRGGKYPGNFTVTAKDGTIREVTSIERRMFCMGFLRDRCTMCNDYAAEFADISIGDYFAEDMVRGTEGWSSLTVRTLTGERLLKGAVQRGYLKVEATSPEFLLGNIGFELKMHGYGYHLEQRKRYGWPTPDYGYPVDFSIKPRRIYLRHPHTIGSS